MSVKRVRPVHQRYAVPRALSAAQRKLDEQGLNDRTPLEQEAATAFLASALAAPSATRPWPVPEVAFDVLPERATRGVFDPDTNTIHINPGQATEWNLLILAAQWLAFGRTHGRRFCSALIELVRGWFGIEPADVLIWALIEHGAVWSDTTAEAD